MANDRAYNLGTRHISSDLQNYESARSNFFSLVVLDLDNLVYPQYSVGTEATDFVTGTSWGKKTGQQVIKLSVNTIYVPHFSMTPIEVRRGNSVVKFADNPSWTSGTITVQDFVGLQVKDVLMAWQALAYDVNNDTQGRASRWQDIDGN